MLDSKEYGWIWSTYDQLISSGPCELLYAFFMTGASTSWVSLYDGANTNGRRIAYLYSAVVTGMPFAPTVPIYCKDGLYIDHSGTQYGCLVVWRDLPK
jgi:hypothetical protein